MNGVAFKTKYLQLTVVVDTTTFTTLHLKVLPLPGQGIVCNPDIVYNFLPCYVLFCS